MTFKVQFNRVYSTSTKATHISFKNYILSKHLFHDLTTAHMQQEKQTSEDNKKSSEIQNEGDNENLPVSIASLSTERNLQEQEQHPSTSRKSHCKHNQDVILPGTSYQSRRKQMKCSICNKVFNHRGDLNKHLRIHSGEKPYVCPNSHCNRRFAHSSNLRRHIVVHSGDKPYNCDKCGRNFNRKDKLLLHQQTRLCKKRSRFNQEKDATSESSSS